MKLGEKIKQSEAANEEILQVSESSILMALGFRAQGKSKVPEAVPGSASAAATSSLLGVLICGSENSACKLPVNPACFPSLGTNVQDSVEQSLLFTYICMY